MEGENSLSTVNCLRGRLLAERLASRNARYEAEQLGNKLLELENLLKEEAKSRNRAQKKLKLLMKRLQSMNISNARGIQESENSENMHLKFSTVCESHESMENVNSPKGSANLQQNDQRDFTDQRVETYTKEGLNQDDDQDLENHVDNSMAIVAVDMPQENRTVDPRVLDETVKEVLDALRHAKERLQSSMERKRMSMIRLRLLLKGDTQNHGRSTYTHNPGSRPCSAGGYIVLRIGVVGLEHKQKLELRLGLVNILSAGSFG
ncbi:hypothetical protein DH2020_017875 [Rehmannia glutinosa]|uniref:Uncharacterized protein n=1 Tax=Rehmannia glutinosa TaxID=99300 RepID=A0ABR0WH83_REHGL